MPDTSPPHLSAIELRVLGVLMEKQLTTPDQYPLTLNSVITACNQKSSRDPVTQYTQGEVTRALNELDMRHFVRRERGSRAEKFEQQFMNQLELGRKQQALLCVMMLRGPQTISELSTRTQRMCDFVDREELELCIDRLCNREIPYTVRLSQQSGQRGERIMHLFSGDAIAASNTDQSTDADNASSVTVSEQVASSTTLPGNSQQNQPSEQVDQVSAEIIELRAMVNSLQEETASLKQQLERLYTLSGHDIDSHAQ